MFDVEVFGQGDVCGLALDGVAGLEVKEAHEGAEAQCSRRSMCRVWKLVGGVGGAAIEGLWGCARETFVRDSHGVAVKGQVRWSAGSSAVLPEVGAAGSTFKCRRMGWEK